MKKIKIKTFEDKMIFSVSLAGIYSLTRVFNRVDNGLSNYIATNNIIQNLGELVPIISRENFTDGKYKTFIRNVALSIGCFTSLIISIRTNGKKCFVDFCFNLVNCTSSILIIDKLKKLNMVDGVSLLVLINFIFNAIKTLSQPLLIVLIKLANCLLFITIDLAIFTICQSYDKLEYKNINNYNFALGICESVFGKLGILLMPLFLIILNYTDIESIKNGFNSNNLLDGIRLENHEKKIVKTVITYSIKVGCLGGMTILLSSLIGICPVYRIGLLTSSLLTLWNDIKSYLSMKKIKENKLIKMC